MNIFFSVIGLFLLMLLPLNAIADPVNIELIPENFFGNCAYEKADGSVVDLSWSNYVSFDDDGSRIHINFSAPSEGVSNYLNIAPIGYNLFDSDDDFRIKISFENFNFVLSGSEDTKDRHRIRLGACSANVLSSISFLGNDLYEAWLWPVGNPQPRFFMPTGGITSGTFVYEKIGTKVTMSFENVPGTEWVFNNVDWQQSIDVGIQINASNGETSATITDWEVEILSEEEPEPLSPYQIGWAGLFHNVYEDGSEVNRIFFQLVDESWQPVHEDNVIDAVLTGPDGNEVVIPMCQDRCRLN